MYWCLNILSRYQNLHSLFFKISFSHVSRFIHSTVYIISFTSTQYAHILPIGDAQTHHGIIARFSIHQRFFSTHRFTNFGQSSHAQDFTSTVSVSSFIISFHMISFFITRPS
ncbi:MAG: hypothetical protein WCG25_05155 [bacterium]